jgi:hypothetical protein
MQAPSVNQAVKYRRFWLGYLWFLIAGLIWSCADAVLDAWAGKTSVLAFTQLVVPALAVWILYGYVAQKRVAPRWVCQLVLGLSWFFLLAITALIGLTALKVAQVTLLLLLLVTWLVSAPQLYAMSQYLDHSPHLWPDSTAPS